MGQGKEEASSGARNRKAGGSAAEARMTALPAAKGRTAGTDNNQAGRMRLVPSYRWGLGSMEPLGMAALLPESAPASEQHGVHAVTREPDL